MSHIKTNVMRILEKEQIAYSAYEYDTGDGFLDGVAVAMRIGKSPGQVFKTLVTRGASGEYYVFVIPSADELDLKAAARAVAEKSIELIKIAEINKVTGYIRGGCSPIGMKKDYKTVVDDSCELFETVIFSAGRPGYQVEIKVADLIRLIHCGVEKIAVPK